MDLLQTCYPDLTADCITNQLVLSQHLDEILQNLAHVDNFSGIYMGELSCFAHECLTLIIWYEMYLDLCLTCMMLKATSKNRFAVKMGFNISINKRTFKSLQYKNIDKIAIP